MSLIKYRVHEVAKDFGVNSKQIMSLLEKYAEKPATTQKVLEERELAIVFDYLTQHNQVESMERVFADVYHEPVAEKPAPKKEQDRQPKAGKAQEKPGQKQAGQQKSGGQKQGGQPAQEQKKGKTDGQGARPGSRIPEKKVVDTPKGGAVNLEKYDEKLENLAAGKTKQMQ
ncbi:MAG: translation initiation factor IF-2 N-terminal domain-containing protein, partial [Oscillospiraceae bacterium]|nr:translation initiation factor IF-2 N-terminal domain-containing protein [Oscillospiraceae bacterium]